ncbi:hypothetical protein BOTNAR_0088g00260 [Botryotinia narcissicola]|uniref:2EXR domain-containing protein n=1 Tax=Botryotinia narcissicola TaxID=278944 RepID=A0A4Z1IT17_9HELO|nr:hypothetical protein BOTNAR_0088g00260 [Botryotinia narcissicola]
MVQYSGIHGAYSPLKQSWSLRILFLMLGSMLGSFFCSIKHSLLPKRPTAITQVAKPTKELSFTCFSRLPLEIRNQIWQSAFQGRTVTLHVHTANQSCYYRSFIPRGIKVNLDLVQAHMPQTLRVNRESRKVTLSQYKDLIQNSTPFRDPVYFNSDLDTMALELYYPTRLGKSHSWIRQKGARNQQKISLDLRDLAERAPNILRVVRSLYLPMIMLEKNSAITYRGALPTCWNGTVQFHALEFVTITGIESDFQHGIPVAFAKRAAEYFQSSFEKEKIPFPDCHIPRLNMFLLDDENEKATGSNDYFRFAGNGLFEDDIVGGSWTLWFQEPENYSKVDSSKKRCGGGFVEESIQDFNASNDDEKRWNHTGRISETENDGVTVASRFNSSRWSAE